MEKRVLFAAAVVVFSMMTGCAATTTVHPAQPIATRPSRVTPVAARYAAALESALAHYEADVRDAVERWYPSYTDSYAVALEHIDAPIAPYVDAAFAEYRVTREEVTAFARAHPAFLRAQNAAYAARMARTRREAFAIMGRIDPHLEIAPPEDVVADEPLVEVATR